MKRQFLTLVVCVLLSASFASAQEFVEGFDAGSNEGGWTWGTGGVVPTGGNPGAYLDSAILDTFAPRLRTTQAGSPFTGDYRAAGVSSVGVDLIQLNSATTGGRPLSPMLIFDNGTGDPSDDTAAYTLGPNIPSLGDGWTSFDFEVPSQATELPPGWLLLNMGDSGAPAIHTWDEVITNVTHLQYFYGDPTFFFIFQQWTLGADNVRITSDGVGDGGSDVPAMQGWGSIALLLIVLTAGAFLLRRRAIGANSA